MGAVLAVVRFILAVGVCLALPACGNDPNRTDPLRLAGLARGEAPAPAIPPRQMARAAMAQLEEPLMLVRLERSGRTALLVPFGENGAVRTWTTVDRQTVSVRGGRIVATRGLGADLMSTTAQGPAQTFFVATTLDAAHATVQFRAICSLAGSVSESVVLSSGERIGARKITEDCRIGDQRVTNEFWIAVDGRVRKSRQWITEGIGYLAFEVLRP